MGIAVKLRKNYVSHKKRWDKQTIVDEGALVKDYALKNKKEIRRVELELKKIKTLTQSLNSTIESQNSAQAKHFMEKLKKQGILNAAAENLDEALDIKVRDILERRFSNIVYKKGLARTPIQARQFVVHGHVMINGKLMNAPSYMVSLDEEASIEFTNKSVLKDEAHPARQTTTEGLQKVVEEIPEEAPVDTSAAEEKVEEEEAPEVKE